MHCETMLHVRDVEASSLWYQKVLGCQSGHGGPDFEMLVAGGSGPPLLLLRREEVQERAAAPPGGGLRSGVCLYIVVADLESAVRCAREVGAEILRGPFENPLSHQRELELRDPDGYSLILCQR